MVTTRFLALILSGALPLVLSLASDAWFALAVAWEAALFALLAVDALLLPSKRKLTASRAPLQDFTMGLPRHVRITAVNHSRRRVRLTVKDTPPFEFDAPDRIRTVRLGGMKAIDVEYEAVCHLRGDYRFGDIYMRATGLFGLCERQYRVPAAAAVAVLPDVKAIRRQQLALELGSRVAFGRRRSRYIQAGSEFARHREYTPGDDYRHISWKATAHRGRLVTKEFEAERSQTVFIMLDCGRMMTTRIGSYSRMDYALNAALQLAAACLGKGDLVGLAAFSGEIKAYLPPRKGNRQWARIVDFTSALQPDYSEPDYARAYGHFLAKVKRRSLVVTFTDLANLGSSVTMVRYNLALIRRHLPLIVSIQDSDITAEALRPSPSIDSLYSRAVAAELLEESSMTLARLETAGCLTVHVPADRLSTAAVNRYLEVKYRGML
jgi:uncharacterized protein (DUF58 family)